VKVIWFDADDANSSGSTVAELESGNSVKIESFFGHTFRFETAGNSQNLGAVVAVNQMYENVFISGSNLNSRIQNQDVDDYKFELHNQRDEAVLLMIVLPVEDESMSVPEPASMEEKLNARNAGKFRFTIARPDERLAFNLPKGYSIQVTWGGKNGHILGSVEAKRGGLAVSVGEHISVQDLFAEPNTATDSSAGTNTATAQRQQETDDNEVVEGVTILPKALPQFKVEVFNKKTKEVRLQLEGINSKTKKGPKNLGEVGAGFKARVPGRQDKILIIQEREDTEGAFYTIERVPLQPGMRIILQNEKNAEVLFGEIQPKGRGEVTAQVGEGGEITAEDAKAEVKPAPEENTTTKQQRQKPPNPKKEIQFDAGVGDDLARLKELEQMFGA
jgi:hypothetical protein